jgi:hypothetical protein
MNSRITKKCVLSGFSIGGKLKNLQTLDMRICSIKNRQKGKAKNLIIMVEVGTKGKINNS